MIMKFLYWYWSSCVYCLTLKSNIYVCFAKARVHFQHSAELLSRLVKVEANYSLQLYPDEGHILREPRSVQHFQRTVVNYLQTCLKHSVLLDPVEDEDEEDDWAQSPLPSIWKDSQRTVRHLMHYLGSDYQAQEHRSGDQAHQITSYDFWKNWCTVKPCCTQLFLLFYCPHLFTKFTWWMD